MGEAMNRPKPAYAAGVLLGFKILATLHPGQGRGGHQIKQMDPNRAFQLFMQDNLELEPQPAQEEDGTDTTQLKKVPSQPPS